MKIKQTFQKFDIEWYQNMITLKQLAFEREMDRGNYHDANIACAQKEYYERKLAELIGKEAAESI